MEHGGWSAPIDIYCEREGVGLWAEPLNAVSNGAFLVAAAMAFVLWRRTGGRDGPALFLVLVTASVGIGSFLFHTFANRWSLLADVIPITVFIYGFFLIAMRRFLGLPAVAAGLATLAFFGLSAAFPAAWAALFGPESNVNGSVSYFPAALALVGVGGLLALRARRAESVLANRKNLAWGAPDEPERARARRDRVEKPDAAGRALLVAAGVFALSLSFRSVDVAVCGWLPFGTHPMWHVSNALVLFLLIRAALRWTLPLAGDDAAGRVRPLSDADRG